jgi:hypothetical protein
MQVQVPPALKTWTRDEKKKQKDGDSLFPGRAELVSIYPAERVLFTHRMAARALVVGLGNLTHPLTRHRYAVFSSLAFVFLLAIQCWATCLGLSLDARRSSSFSG